MMVGHQKKIECMIARSCSDIDDDHVRSDILKIPDQALFLCISHVGRRQRIARAGNDPQVRVNRKTLSQIVQMFDSMVEEVSQGE